ncbi:GNAT family N-acetyltransferase [Paenibacillus pini]|uniref:Acetyltransferase n=1 Tax=Paenibacillus pini JCM 16418 TaxID=1236976 RepID=W7YWA6_9BACL|nr:GNAT family N-acetyltransferase [Paenibacillus pini]GAF06604.1 acetyltransferase [Paenibacillus pini JCM 16418]
MEIETSRLIIRDFRKEDWIDVHTYASDPKVTEFMIWGPNSEDETKTYIEEQITKQQSVNRVDFEFGVILKETSQFIGGCGIYIKERNAEIGYCFSPEYWGHGYATEASEAMLEFGFKQFHVHRVFATCRPGNHASANVMKRIGMKQEGHLREHMWHKGRYHDSYLFSILEHEYSQGNLR